MHISGFRRHAPAVTLFAFTLVLRITAAWRLANSAYGTPSSGDMRFYAEWARRIADGQLTDYHAFYGQPLYAYLLGAFFWLVGFQPALVSLLQGAVDAGTAVLIYKIGTLVFPAKAQVGRIVGGIAAVGWALFVPAAAYSGLLIPTAWTVFAWWLCIWWLLARSGRAGGGEWLLIATFTGVLAMASATILFVLPLLALKAFTRRSITAGAAIFAGVALGTAPAWIHNAVVARDPVFLSAHSGLNFWIGNNPEANGYPRVPRELPSEQAALLGESIKVAEAAAGQALPRSAVSAFWSAKASDYIRSHPGDWARLLARKAWNFWNAFEYDDLSSITPLRDAGIVPPGLSFGLLAAVGLPGLLLAVTLPRARYIAFAVLLQMLALLPVFVNERYRLAAAPGLLLLSALFMAELWRAIASARWSRAGVLIALVIVSTAFATRPPGDRALSALNDYKSARRHIMAREFGLGEMRMRRALQAMLGAQHLASPVANGFAEVASEQSQSGEDVGALATIDAGLRIDPANQRLRQLQQRLGGNPGAAD